MGGRHYYLAKNLVARGYTVYVIASGFTHLLRKPPVITQDFTMHVTEGINFIWVKLPHYINAKSKKRVFNWFLFSYKLRHLSKFIQDRPDSIVYSSPTLIGYLGARRIANKYKVPLVFDVRDIWPLTLSELGGYSSKNLFIVFLQWIEDKAYRESKSVISNLPNAVSHMVSRGMDPNKFTWIPNGFERSEIANLPLPSNLEQEIPKNKFIIGYIGTLGIANALNYLLEAAYLLKDQKNIAFVLTGNGASKDKLMDFCLERQLCNVVFINSIEKCFVQSMLQKFDVCYIGWNNEPMYRFGIGANKIPEYLISQKPILHSYSGQFDPIEKIGAGICVEAENPKAISEGIMCLYKTDKTKLAEMGQKGYSFSIDKYSYDLITDDFISAIF